MELRLTIMCGAFNRFVGAGMASMHVMDSDALAALAKIIGRPEETRLRARADTMRALIETHLWDDSAGIYTNQRYHCITICQ